MLKKKCVIPILFLSSHAQKQNYLGSLELGPILLVMIKSIKYLIFLGCK